MNKNTILKVVVGALALYGVYTLIKMRKPMSASTSKGSGEKNFTEMDAILENATTD
jgi:hypothetical protein